MYYAHRFLQTAFAKRLRAALLLMCGLICGPLGYFQPAHAASYPQLAETVVNSILREGAGTHTPPLRTLSTGATVIALGKSNDWYQVQYGNLIGYMRQDLLRLTDTGADVDVQYPTPSFPEAPNTDAPAPSSPSQPIPPSSPSGGELGSRILSQGSRGNDVRQLQQLLVQYGFLSGGADGIFGPLTRSAVARFQSQSGLAADGIAGPRTFGVLLSGGVSAPPPAPSAPIVTPNPPPSPGNDSPDYDTSSGSYPMLKKGSTGEAVRSLQSALQSLGYYAGAISGTYDAATAEAVTAFQRNNGTGVDGVAGPATQTILYERTPRPAWEAPPAPAPLPDGAGAMQGPNTSQVELAHWFNDVKKSYRSGQTYTVYDPASGLGWNLKLYAMGNHADSEPLTQLDTDIMFKAFNYTTTWTPKPVYAHMPDGRWILAATHNTPHLTGSISTNGFDGHLCVHFYRDMEEVTVNDPNYGVQNQNTIRAHWKTLGH